MADIFVRPDSPLARLLAKVKRPEQRLILAAVQAKPGPRRDRMEREVQRRLKALGIDPG